MKRHGLLKPVLGGMNWQSAKGPSALSCPPKGPMKLMSIYGKSQPTYKKGLHEIKVGTKLIYQLSINSFLGHLGDTLIFHFTQTQKNSTQNFTILKLAHNSCFQNKTLQAICEQI